MSSLLENRGARKLTRGSAIISVLACVALAGCASGGGLHRIEDAPVLPHEAGKDLVKFEVREQSALNAAGSLAVTPARTRQRPSTIRKSRPSGKRSFEYPSRRPKNDPIWLGERFTYDENYLGVSAGQFTLKTLPFKEINGRKVYHIFGEAISGKVFSLFYSLRDTIETFIDFESISPHRFHLVLDESKQKRNSLELYDSEKGETFFWNRANHYKKGYIEVKDSFPMQPFSQDSLSSLFYLRTVDLPDGAIVKFPVVSEGKNWDAEVTVIRRETLDTPMGRIRAVVLKPETKYQGVLKKQGDSFIWMSDDDRRMLLRLEAKIKIGTLVAELKSFDPGTKESSTVPPVPAPTPTNDTELRLKEVSPGARKIPGADR